MSQNIWPQENDKIGKRISYNVGDIQFRCPYCDRPNLSLAAAIRHYEREHND